MLLVDRFLAKVKEMESGCHEWQSTLHPQGYGRFWFEGRQVFAHRMAYQLFVGEIPLGMLVCHICDNPRCVNPNHLFLGSYQDNARDMVNKKRHWGRRKLEDNEVLEIIALIKKGELSQEKIAAQFNVKQVAISRIKLGQRKYLDSLNLYN